MKKSYSSSAPYWRQALAWWEIALAAPQVVAHRTQRIARAGMMPSLQDQAEFALMGREKAEAFVEASLAMWLRLAQVQQSLFTTLAGQWLSPPLQTWTRALPAIAAAGLKPVHRRVTANARRLSRR